MAFSSSAVWEVESGASDSNGGGFDPGVTGFPTDGTVDTNTGNTSAPVFSSASYNFVAGDVGAWIFIKSGTNSIPGWYKIASVASNKATLNAAIGAATLFSGLSGATTAQQLTLNTAVGLATVGTPTNLTWGVDYSQQTGAKIAFTDMVIGGAVNTTFTSAANPVGKNFVGNVINVTSGTGFTVQRVAVSSTSGTVATCDKSLGTLSSTGGNGNLGGAFASPALPGSVAGNSNTVAVKAATYTITSASTSVTGGCFTSAATALSLVGYSTVRGDLDNVTHALSSNPLLQASGISTFTIAATTGQSSVFRNISVDGAALTSSRGFSGDTSGSTAINCSAVNCTNTGILGFTSLIRCKASGCTTTGSGINARARAHGCEAFDNTVTGFTTGAAIGSFTNCLAYGNTGASSDGFFSANSNISLIGCVAYGNGRDGFRLPSSTGSAALINCIAESNAGVGFSLGGANGQAIVNCGYYGNGTDLSVASGAAFVAIGTLAASGSVFANAAGDDFSLNDTSGRGLLLRAAGFPGSFPAVSTTSYLDVGAIQRQDAAPGVTSGGPAHMVNGGLTQ